MRVREEGAMEGSVAVWTCDTAFCAGKPSIERTDCRYGKLETEKMKRGGVSGERVVHSACE
jgi:hypothetical protein